MRESNFAFPAQNRACVCISSQLYDRRETSQAQGHVRSLPGTPESAGCEKTGTLEHSGCLPGADAVHTRLVAVSLQAQFSAPMQRTPGSTDRTHAQKMRAHFASEGTNMSPERVRACRAQRGPR
ncbi:hypothetical protein VTO73DRAFT_13948 [Trametes versicolor]